MLNQVDYIGLCRLSSPRIFSTNLCNIKQFIYSGRRFSPRCRCSGISYSLHGFVKQGLQLSESFLTLGGPLEDLMAQNPKKIEIS